jgi:hypothetical protein
MTITVCFEMYKYWYQLNMLLYELECFTIERLFLGGVKFQEKKDDSLSADTMVLSTNTSKCYQLISSEKKIAYQLITWYDQLIPLNVII